MTIIIKNSKVIYHPEFSSIQTFIYADLKDQSTSTLKELGVGKEDKCSIEYEQQNKSIIILWK